MRTVWARRWWIGVGLGSMTAAGLSLPVAGAAFAGGRPADGAGPRGKDEGAGPGGKEAPPDDVPDRDAPAIDSPFEAAEVGCLERHEIAGCLSAARGWQTGRGAPRADPEQAEALFRAACSFGSAEGCSEAATLYLTLRVGMLIEVPDGTVTADMDQASRLLRASCELGRRDACGLWGEILLNPAALLRDRGAEPRGLEADPILAVQAWSEGCGTPDGDPGPPPEGPVLNADLRSCVRLAEVYERGLGVRADPVRAARLWRRACAVPGGAYACDRATALEAATPTPAPERPRRRR